MQMSAAQYFAKETGTIWEIVDTTDQARLYVPIRDDNSSAWDIIAHVAIASRELLKLARASLQAAQAGNPPPWAGPDFDVHRWNVSQVNKWRDTSFTDIRRHWQETLISLETFANTLSQDDLAIPVKFATGEDMNLGELLLLMSYHLRQHRQELQQGLAALDTKAATDDTTD